MVDIVDYKLVPVDPTHDMERAAESYWNERRFKGLSDDPRTWEGVYQAMLAAAPEMQEQHPTSDVSILVEALEELVDLMEDTRQGEYTPDSFTTQPARIAIDAYRRGGE